MPLDSFLAVPVAAVSDNWLEKSFLPALNAALVVPGLWLLPIDAGPEADYLLTVVASECSKRSLRTKELLVDPIDPLRFWGDFAGDAEKSGLTPAKDENVWLVRNGELLSISGIQTHLKELMYFIEAVNLVVIWPIFHQSLVKLGESTTDRTRFEIPSLRDAPSERVESLVKSLVTSRIPALSGEKQLEARNKFVRRILSFEPVSRPQLEAWIDFFADVDDPTESQPFPPIVTDLLHTTPEIPTRHELQTRFVATRQSLLEIDKDFSLSENQRLLFLHQELKDPFSSSEPEDWFFGLVSFISCIVFDAGKNTLGTLGKFTFVAATCDFEGKPASDLLSYLRDMRTAFQHAVNTENDRNNRNLENVANWYCRHCGSGTPQKRHFRVLTERLLRDWELFVEGVGRVVANLGRTKTTKLVRNQLKLAARNLEGGDLLEMIERAGRLIGAALDTVAFKKKHEASIRDHMKNSPLSGPLLLDFVYKKVEEAVIAECNLCPVDGEWLIKQGVPQSPKMGKLLKQFQSDWDQAPPGQDKELFLRNAAATVQAYLERMA